MKKIILIIYAKDTNEVFNRQSALGSYIHCLASILVEKDYNVRINDIEFNHSYQHKSTSVIRQNSSIIKKIIPAFIKEFIKDKRLFRSIKQLYNKIDNPLPYEKIIEFYTYGSEIGYKLSKKYHTPLILVYDSPVVEDHSYFRKTPFFFKSKIEELETNSLLQSQSIIVYSNAVKNYLNKKYNRILPCIIHQNIDFTRFAYIENKVIQNVINIGFIGSFLKWHRVDLLLNVFTKLKTEGWNIKLFLLGTGMEFYKIQNRVKKNKYVDNIEIPGFVDGEILLNYKKEIHIGVMPSSNWYGAPNKIFEYGAAKMAVVAPNTLTINDLFIDKKEVILFENNSEEGLYYAIKKLCEDRILMHTITNNLQQKIKLNYSKNNTFDFYNHLITNATS